MYEVVYFLKCNILKGLQLWFVKMEFIFNLREQYLFEKLLFIGQLIFWVFCYFFLFFSNQR